MKLLFINQFYWPDSAATAQQLADLTEHLIEEGHDVRVLCSRGAYRQDSADAGGSRALKSVKATRFPGLGLGKFRIKSRVLGYAWFHLCTALWLLAFGWRQQLIVSLTTPPLIGLVPSLQAKLCGRRMRHVLWLMDMHPDIEIALGEWNPKRLWVRTLNALATATYRLSDKVVVLTAGMRDHVVAKGIPAANVDVISVWSDLHAAPFGEKPTDLEAELGLEDKLVVMYSGNAGIAHTFKALCGAMKLLRERTDIHFLFVGGGARHREVTDFAAANQIQNFTSRGYFPRERLNESVALGDIHVVTLRGSLDGMLIPSKIMGILAAARPILLVSDPKSEASRLVATNGLGRSFPEDDTHAIATWLSQVAKDRSLLQEPSRLARAHFEANFSRTLCTRSWAELVDFSAFIIPSAAPLAGTQSEPLAESLAESHASASQGNGYTSAVNHAQASRSPLASTAANPAGGPQ